MDNKQAVKELTLMLLFLTSWTEKDLHEVQRSWKGYDFDILNELADEGFISDSKRSKSVYLFEDGVVKANSLLKKYGLNSLE